MAEVYRAGIESVHPSQTAAARSLGLSRVQTLRFVVVPQAVRRVIPPLLNDFIALQKDTALIAIVARAFPEAFLQAQIYQAADFNFTPIVGRRAVLPGDHDPDDAVHGLGGRAASARSGRRGRCV